MSNHLNQTTLWSYYTFLQDTSSAPRALV